MKIYLSKINESWIIDRVRKEFYKYNPTLTTHNKKKSDIFWLISPWLWKNENIDILKNKKIVCSHYHFDFDNFDKNDFYKLDKFVDHYHVISKNTKSQLKTLTDKPITSIPFWINQNIFFEILDKDKLRSIYKFSQKDFLIGSFQRDTEGSDLISPKLIKGPDIFINLVSEIYKENKNTKIVLAGKRRQYVINELKNLNIPYFYFEMVNFKKLNHLYNLLDLYLVTSRLEGGPQAILESAITRTPILSTKVGVAPEILHESSIINLNSFDSSVPNIDYAYNKSIKYTIPSGINLFNKMFKEIYES